MTTPKTLNRFERQRLISCNVLCECHNSSVDLRTFTVEKTEKERRRIWCLAPQSPRSNWHHFQSLLTGHRKSMTASASSRIVEVTLQGHRWRRRDRLLADHPTMERQEAGISAASHYTTIPSTDPELSVLVTGHPPNSSGRLTQWPLLSPQA